MYIVLRLGRERWLTTYIKGWFDLKRAFYVHDCRGAVPWPFDVVLGAIESS